MTPTCKLFGCFAINPELSKTTRCIMQVIPSVTVVPSVTAVPVGSAAGLAFSTNALAGLTPNTEYTYSLQLAAGGASTGCTDLAASDTTGVLAAQLPLTGLSLTAYGATGVKAVTLSVYTKKSCCCGAQPGASAVITARGTTSVTVSNTRHPQVCSAGTLWWRIFSSLSNHLRVQPLSVPG